MKLLIFEDSHRVRESLADFFATLPALEVVIASDAPSAIARCRKWLPDLAKRTSTGEAGERSR